MPKYTKKGILGISMRQFNRRAQMSSAVTDTLVSTSQSTQITPPTQTLTPSTLTPTGSGDNDAANDNSMIRLDNFEECVRVALSELSSDEDEDDENTMASFLQHWTHEYSIQKVALNALLKKLKDDRYPNLPRDSRTLLSTPVKNNIVTVAPGHYGHIGLFKALDNYLSKCSSIPSMVSVDLNVDGVPISRSNSNCFWTILAQIFGDNFPRKICVIGVYQGMSKPHDFNEFLHACVMEMRNLDSYKFNGQFVKVQIRCIICDAPARNSCLGNKAHSGYWGCGRCSQKGVRRSYRMTFPEIRFEKRTNESFRTEVQPEHHISKSPFLALNIDMVAQFPLEYLHTVCIGVVKKTIAMWNKAVDGDHRGKLSPKDLLAISHRLTSVAQTQPIEFQRKSRPLKDFANFKATEFRTLVLYTLPVVSHGILSDDQYSNIIYLHVAITILIDPILHETHADFAHKLLEEFVRTYSEIYGRRHIIYNVHSMLHVVDDVKNHGSLDNYSAFPFESFMSKIKRMLKKNNDQLAQICNRIEESYILHEKFHPASSKVKFAKPENCDGNQIYKRVIFPNFVLDCSSRNQWFLTKNREIFKFDSYRENNEGYIYASRVIRKHELYSVPISSSHLDIYKSDGAVSCVVSVPILDIKNKIFAMPIGNEIVFAPLRHAC